MKTPWSRSSRSRLPKLDGHLHPAFSRVAYALREQLARTPGGAGLCVYHLGECVLDLWGGSRDEEGRPWCADTMAPSFSTTKGVASTLLHMMVDRGLLEYEDRVAKHWPEFAQAGKQDVTVRHVLAHQSGLYHIRQMIDDAGRMLDWDYMINAIERTPPAHPPGERTGYHGLTFGYLVGEILQRVTGASFAELVESELVEPLGLDGMYVGAPSEELHRRAQLLWPRQTTLGSKIPDGMLKQVSELGAAVLERGANLLNIQLDIESIIDSLAPRGIEHFDFGSEETLRASIPAANGLFTARSLARMYAALAGGGEIDGVRLLSQRTLQRATYRQRGPGPLAVIPFDMRWRLGYHGVFTTVGSPRHAFGHFGFGGSGAWADPSRDLAVGMIVNAGLGTPFGDSRIARISGAILRAADARSGRARRDARNAAPEPSSAYDSEIPGAPAR